MGQGRGAATTQAAQDDEQDNFHIVCMVWVSHEHRLLGCDSPGRVRGRFGGLFLSCHGSCGLPDFQLVGGGRAMRRRTHADGLPRVSIEQPQSATHSLVVHVLCMVGHSD